MKKEKKIFVMSKVYTMTETNISEIEKSVQKNIDDCIGKDIHYCPLKIANSSLK